MNINVFDLKKKKSLQDKEEPVRHLDQCLSFLMTGQSVSKSVSFLLLKVELFGLIRFIFFYFSQSAATSNY